jgi:hypothetical protein
VTGLVKPDDPDAKIKFLAAEALCGVPRQRWCDVTPEAAVHESQGGNRVDTLPELMEEAGPSWALPGGGDD